jgi:cytoskeleton protein RodZ
MSSNSDTPKEDKSAGIGPGDRLQAARIEQGLSIEDIANKMHLSVSILESIEENDFDDITAPIFVKGYLRAYARIVSLSEEEMIQQYLEFYSDEDPPISSTSNTSPQISSDDARVKWTTYIVVLILCGLLGAWWWSNNQKYEETVSLDVDENSSSQQVFSVANNSSNNVFAASEAEAGKTMAGVEPEAEPERALEIIEKEAEALDQTQVIATGQSEAVSEEVSVENIAQAQQEQTIPDPVIEDSTSEVEAGTVETVEAPEVIQAADAGVDVINLIIIADTWADIKDATGNRLAYDLLRADRELTLTGQAPFTAFFGNGHGVEVRFNGEQIDVLSATRSDNTARLKIGSD